jgi:TetR/AcrR family transcriptional regulator, fatty acid metabolism regulator protein
MLALFEIWMNLRSDDGALRMSEADAESTVDAIEQLLAAGQASGDFGDFSARVMAMAVRQAIDGVLLQLRVDPHLDLDEYARELVALFDRATRRTS